MESNACFHAAFKAPKISWQLISDSIQQSSLFCLKMLKLSCQNGSLCKSFFSEMRNSKFIQWICQWQKAFSIKRTHTPSTQWPTMVHWLSYQRNVKRETLAHFYFCEEREKRAVWQCISAWKNIQMTPAISQQRNTT